MSQDQNDSVERTLEEILAELDLLPASPPAPAGAKPPAEAVPAAKPPAEPPPVKKEAPPAPKRAAEAVTREAPAVKKSAAPIAAETITVPAKPSPENPKGEADEEESAYEPTTMVFRPIRQKGKMKITASAAAPARPLSRPAASLKEELEQLSRSSGGQSLTEQLRAKEQAAHPASSVPQRPAARKKSVSPAAKKGTQPPASKAQPEKPAALAVRQEALPAALAAEAPKKSKGWKRELFEWGRTILITFAVFFLLFFVLLRFVSVEGESMAPTLQEGDRLIISGVLYTPHNGDIVVTSAKNGLQKPLVKRVIAVAGQTVDIDSEGKILVNGFELAEDYTEDLAADRGDQEYPLTVPEGCVFLMGDNRDHSTDSRSSAVGMIPEDEIVGRVLMRVFPFGRFGTVR